MVLAKDLPDILSYDPDTGILRWKKPGKSNLRLVGMIAGSRHDGRGYLKVQVCGKPFLAHRVAWALHYGVWPAGQIDHVNGIKSDNRITNLRVCTNAQNAGNRPKRAGAYSSRFKGVRFSKTRSCWVAKCRDVFLGTFNSEEEAARAYDAAAMQAHGAFAYLNFPKEG